MIRSRLMARNVILSLGTQLLSWVLAFAVTLYLPRYVGAAGLGKLSFAASFVAVFGVIVPLGTSTVLVKEIARDRGRTGELLLAAAALRVPMGLMMTALAIVGVYALGYPALTRTLVMVTAVGMVLGTLNDALGAALQGQEKIGRQNAAVIIQKFLGSALTIALILYRAPLWAIAAVGFFAGVIALAMNLTGFKDLLSTLRWPSAFAVRSLAIAGLPFMGWTVFQTLYGQTDPIVLSLVTNDAAVGWYAAAARLVGAALFIPTAIVPALLPPLARLFHDDLPGFKRLADRALSLCLFCAVPIAAVLIILPGRLIAMMHYPSEFAQAIPVLRVGGAAALLYFAASPLGAAVIAADGQSKMLRTAIAATLIGIPACFIGSYLAQRFWGNGAVGAGLSDTLLEMYLIRSYLQMAPVGTFTSQTVSFIGRYLLAAAPMSLVMFVASRSGSGLWILAPCGISYVLICWALRCIGWSDIRLVKAALTRTAE